MIKKILIILAIFCVLSFSTVHVEARAGGGSSSGSSSGGSSTSSPHYHQQNNQGGWKSSLISTVSFIGFAYVVVNVKRYYLRIKAKQTRHQLKKQMNVLDNQDGFWNEKQIKKRVKENYYRIQEAWSNQDIETLKLYLTPELLDAWITKLNWYEFQGKRNVLKDIRLIDHEVIELYDSENDDEDYFWVYIEGKMDDRMIGDDHQVIEKNANVFIEYWKFKRHGNDILLDEIKQDDELFL